LAVQQLRAVLQALETAASPDAYPGCGLEFAKPRTGSTAVFQFEVVRSAFRQRELLQRQNEKRRPAVKEVARSGDRATARHRHVSSQGNPIALNASLA
jgi:hypothetical protein